MPPKDVFLSQPITPTIKCPSCGETLMYGATQCRFCSSEISASYAEKSVVSQVVLTAAIKNANTIRSLRKLLYFLLVMTIFATLRDPPYLLVLVVLSLLNLIGPIKWLRSYGGLDANTEVVQARKAMKTEFWLWLAAGIVQAGIWTWVVTK